VVSSCEQPTASDHTHPPWPPQGLPKQKCVLLPQHLTYLLAASHV
jgi:hypothetical protein